MHFWEGFENMMEKGVGGCEGVIATGLWLLWSEPVQLRLMEIQIKLSH
jgi:hypothetical protein